AAFEGWNDAGDAATSAARHLADRLDATPLASIDPERYFDFGTTRPLVHLDEDRRRTITWPTTEVLAARVPSADRDVVIVVGLEPQLQWRRYCRQVLTIADAVGASSVITLGALLADVPHTRPVEIYGATDDPVLMERLDLSPSTYEGPTGIVGVLTTESTAAGRPTTTYWAAVPSYVPGAPSPKAALALVHRVCETLGTSVFVTDLEIATASYERQVDELVAEDEDTAAYVRDLETEWDEAEDDDLEDDPELLVAEVEEFLRAGLDLPTWVGHGEAGDGARHPVDLTDRLESERDRHEIDPQGILEEALTDRDVRGVVGRIKFVANLEPRPETTNQRACHLQDLVRTLKLVAERRTRQHERIGKRPTGRAIPHGDQPAE
ncbi:MAG: PAC2 family protein, partial [Acidimicrobiia bacterium]|nr:PAC2 family protein [Acidimicrobiia bacterium]